MFNRDPGNEPILKVPTLQKNKRVPHLILVKTRSVEKKMQLSPLEYSGEYGIIVAEQGIFIFVLPKA
jgi:hypothetical protein